ncbi:MAG: DEAD/DEAH box helicase family protein [Methanobrevibacter sp. CfCl-M3]
MLNNKFLYEKLDSEIGKRTIERLDIDDEVLSNLNPKFILRDYQKSAFRYFKTYFEDNEIDFKECPISVLFNMATGSGKTLIMAGLILYLYKKGYNNFLFFVNSNNIIEKTKDNFLNSLSNKYLFNEKISFMDRNVNINEVNNFEGINKEDINICFTTIQKLHSDLNNEKENSITFEDFSNNKIVLISDEAHHGQSKTKQKTISNKPNWENTVEEILKVNKEHVLLEFTATMGLESNEEIYKKYLKRLLYKYDLKSYVNDRYSKNIEIFKVDGTVEYRMLLAILINQYRQDLAIKHGIKNFKPVILFKAVKEIKESHENHEIFRNLVDNLKKYNVEEIKEKIDDQLIKKIFLFYEDEGLSTDNLIRKIQINFSEERCINVNEGNLDLKKIQNNKAEKKELIKQQGILNNLESKNNSIRAIFAVKKLNEGWDVLNLFDIVKVSPDAPLAKNKIHTSTVSEAQLIGRGARYYPFKINDSDEKYKRKFDKDLNNDLRILEELYFHSYDESKYINDLKKALVEEGLINEEIGQQKLVLKNDFKETELYNEGNIFINTKKKKKNYGLNSFESVKYFSEPSTYNILSGRAESINSLDEKKEISKTRSTIIKGLNDMEKHIIKNAISKIDFYRFNNIKKYFPNINSINEIIDNDKFLNKMNIKLKGNENDLTNLTNKNKLNAVYNLLNLIKDEIINSVYDYSGTEFFEKPIHEIFHDKELNIDKTTERYNGMEEYLRNKDWYVFNANYGTDEEKSCVEFIESIMKDLNKRFSEIYLIRNEEFFKIYNCKDGRAFAPDFVLFMKDGNGESINYQLFIEPKGNHLKAYDSWKEEFLESICFNKKLFKYDGAENEYKIIGVPFFNKMDENKFKSALFEKLEIK